MSNLEDFFCFRDDFDINERYVQTSETEIKKTKICKKPITEYDFEEKKIINDILNEIFNYLDFNYQDDQTYMGYFQKIINYILYNESEIIIDYLFNEPYLQIKKLYKHLDKVAISNVLENLLNILADKEDNEIDIKDSKYNNIIQDFLKEVTNDEEKEKAEPICQLIINTIINNSESQFIKLIFNDDNIISKLSKIIEVIINKKNTKTREIKEHFNKTIIGIMQIICQINSIIINSFSESLYYKKNNDFKISFADIKKKVNIFEYQYLPKKNISIKKIFEAFEKKINVYLKEIQYLFNLIKNDVLINYEEYNQKNKNNILSIMHLYEWKLIASIYKLYIYSFYAMEKPNNDHNYFEGQNLIKILINYYFAFPKNNIFQNIFIEIIKLICDEKCPFYLVTSFFNEINLDKFLYIILENIKEYINKKENKYALLLGVNIEILNIFYSSNNQQILKFMKNNFKEIFNDYMKPKLDCKLLDQWEYSYSEIFNSENENNDTFDGNDISINRHSFKKIIIKFLEKCEKKENELNIKAQFKALQTDKNYGINKVLNNIDNYKNIFEKKEEKLLGIKKEEEFNWEKNK